MVSDSTLQLIFKKRLLVKKTTHNFLLSHFPAGPVAKTLLPMQGNWARSLVRSWSYKPPVRVHMPQLRPGAAKQRKKKKMLLSFPAIYLCEAGFFSCTSTKTTHGRRMDAEAGMRIPLSLNQTLQRFTLMQSNATLLNTLFFWIKNVCMRGFPAGSVVENPLANAGDVGSTPDLGWSLVLQSN